MPNESNQDAVTTLRLMAEAAQQLFLLDMLRILFKGISLGDISPSSPAIIRFIECAKTRFDDPSFRHTWELVTASLIKASEREELELGSTMPTAEIDRYITLIDNMNRQLARLDELISQQ